MSIGCFGLLACGLLVSVTARAENAPASAVSALSARDPNARAELAQHWAPIHYQDVDVHGTHSLGGAADYITAYDFDGDLDARNNWDHAGLAAYPLRAAAYFSVVESATHWFIVYLYFHPRDWARTLFDTEHENDAEGVLLSVARDGSAYGTLKAAVTVAHRDFYSYVPSGSDWRARLETIDGTLSMQSYAGSLHPVTAQESKGHGLKARPYYDIEGGDGVVYYPSLTDSEVPSGPNDRSVRYRLLDIFAPGGMWENRDNPQLFAGFGSFAGNKSGGCGDTAIACVSDAAHAPWAWDDANDRSPRGALGLDPAGLVNVYFNMPERLSMLYTFDPYQSVRQAPAIAARSRVGRL